MCRKTCGVFSSQTEVCRSELRQTELSCVLSTAPITGEIPGSNLGLQNRPTRLTVFCIFPQALRENSGILFHDPNIDWQNYAESFANLTLRWTSNSAPHEKLKKVSRCRRINITIRTSLFSGPWKTLKNRNYDLKEWHQTSQKAYVCFKRDWKTRDHNVRVTQRWCVPLRSSVGGESL